MHDIPKHNGGKLSYEGTGYIMNHSRNVTKPELIEEHEKSWDNAEKSDR